MGDGFSSESKSTLPGKAVSRAPTPHHWTDGQDTLAAADHAVRGPIAEPPLTLHNMLALQRSVGNQAVQRLIAQGGAVSMAREVRPTPFTAMGGLKPDVSPEQTDQVVGGIGEAVGDIARPVGAALGNAVGWVAGAATGVDVTSSTNSGPTWSPHGHFDWRVGLTTTGRNRAAGWLVQGIENTIRAEDAAGTALPTGQYTPNYWEAWQVDAAGVVTPAVGANNDYWIRPSWGANTTGHWSMTGSVYFTTTDPATQGFVAGGVANAGMLLSTTTQPTGLGIARLHRYAQGTWDSKNGATTHSGSAGP